MVALHRRDDSCGGADSDEESARQKALLPVAVSSSTSLNKENGRDSPLGQKPELGTEWMSEALGQRHQVRPTPCVTQSIAPPPPHCPSHLLLQIDSTC